MCVCMHQFDSLILRLLNIYQDKSREKSVEQLEQLNILQENLCRSSEGDEQRELPKHKQQCNLVSGFDKVTHSLLF